METTVNAPISNKRPTKKLDEFLVVSLLVFEWAMMEPLLLLLLLRFDGTGLLPPPPPPVVVVVVIGEAQNLSSPSTREDHGPFDTDMFD